MTTTQTKHILNPHRQEEINAETASLEKKDQQRKNIDCNETK